MSARPRSARTAGARRLPALAAALAAVLAAVLAAGSAAAHSRLTSSIPAADETMTAAPPRAVLVFDEDARVTAVRLLDAQARRLDLPGEVAADEPGRASVPLPALAPGAYVIEWRAISADGHPIRGTIPFVVAPDAQR